MPRQIVDRAGLRVWAIKEGYLALVPPSLRRLVKELGLVIQIPLPLIRNRSAYEHDNQYLPLIQKYVAIEFYKAIAYKTLTQTHPQFVFEGFPFDWETNDAYWDSIHFKDRPLAALAEKINRGDYAAVTEKELKDLLTPPGRLDKESQFLKLILLLEVATDPGEPGAKTSLFLRRLAIQAEVNEDRARRQRELLAASGFSVGTPPRSEEIPFYRKKIAQTRQIETAREQLRHAEKYLVDPRDYSREEQALVDLALSIGRHFGIEQILLVENKVTFAGGFLHYNGKATMLLFRSLTLKMGKPQSGTPIMDEATDTVVHELAHWLEEAMRRDQTEIWQEGFVAHQAGFTHDAVGFFAEGMKYVSGVSLVRAVSSDHRSEVRYAPREVQKIRAPRQVLIVSIGTVVTAQILPGSNPYFSGGDEAETLIEWLRALYSTGISGEEAVALIRPIVEAGIQPSRVAGPSFSTKNADQARHLFDTLMNYPELVVVEYQIPPAMGEGETGPLFLHRLLETIRNSAVLNGNIKVRLVVRTRSEAREINRLWGRVRNRMDQTLIKQDQIQIFAEEEGGSVHQGPAHIVVTQEPQEALGRLRALSAFDSARYEDGNRIRFEDGPTPSELFLAALAGLTQKTVEGLTRFESGIIRAESRAALNPFALLVQMMAQEAESTFRAASSA